MKSTDSELIPGSWPFSNPKIREFCYPNTSIFGIKICSKNVVNWPFWSLKPINYQHYVTGTAIPLSISSFLVRDVIYTSRAYAMMPVRLSVTEVHWRIIANLCLKFQCHFTAHWPPCCWRAPCCLRANHLAPC